MIMIMISIPIGNAASQQVLPQIQNARSSMHNFVGVANVSLKISFGALQTFDKWGICCMRVIYVHFLYKSGYTPVTCTYHLVYKEI